MFKFLKDKLKQAVSAFSKDVDEESKVVEQPPEEPIKKEDEAGKNKDEKLEEKEPEKDEKESVEEEPEQEEKQPEDERPIEEEPEDEEPEREEKEPEKDEKESVEEEPEDEEPEREEKEPEDERPIEEEPEDEEPEREEKEPEDEEQEEEPEDEEPEREEKEPEDEKPVEEEEKEPELEEKEPEDEEQEEDKKSSDALALEPSKLEAAEKKGFFSRLRDKFRIKDEEEKFLDETRKEQDDSHIKQKEKALEKEEKISKKIPKEEKIQEKAPEEDMATEKKAREEHLPEIKPEDKKAEDKRSQKAPEKEETAPQDKISEKKEEKKPQEKHHIPAEPQKKISAEEARRQKQKERAEQRQTEEDEEKQERGFFSKLTDAVTKSAISEHKFDELFWELEIALLENSVAVEVIEKIKQDLKEELVNKKVRRGSTEKIISETLARSISELFDVEQIDVIEKAKAKKPYIISFIGINGSGKTTTIAKFAKLMQENGLRPVMAAADTFRAAAIQQLEEHAKILNVKLIKHDYGSDPAAVAFDAIKYAESGKADVVLIDTAGRLHSNSNLMDEMKKIMRVAKPDIKIFVGESITGNDCVEQAKKFDEAVGIDGIILAKADVDDKGGAAISVSYVTGKPILYLGTGQRYEDLKKFSPELVVESIGLR